VREAALEAVLGEHDGGPPLLVEPPQQPDELVAGDRVELRGRLVEEHEPRAAGERGAERDALQLAAGQLARRRSSSASMPSASATSSTPRATAAGAAPRFSSGNASSLRTVPSTICVSGPGTASRRQR
jgi:hypothetical protein